MNKYEETKFIEAMLAKFHEETGRTPTPEEVEAWIDAKDEQEKLALGDAMKRHKEADENMENMLRLVDEGKDPSFFRKTIELWAKDKTAEQIAKFKLVLEAMIQFLDPSYEGKISAAAFQIKGNGEEMTRRTREALIAMLEAI